MTSSNSKTIAAALLLGTAAVACQPNPAPEKKEPTVATTNKPGTPAKTEPVNGDAGTPATATKAVPAQPAKDCCFYCFEGVPCGTSCLPEGGTCQEATTCACEASERPQPEFRKGERALAGIIRADVAAFNKAQGDPVDGDFTLAMAFEGDAALADKSQGKLHATIETDLGSIECELYEDRAPLTVANFVGLGRGTRPWYDRKTKSWTKGIYFKDILFHRIIAGFMVQTGDHTGSGTGGPGYFVPDEYDPKLKHDKKGLLSMANRNRPDRMTKKLKLDPKTGQHMGNTGSSQFFITVRKTPHLDMKHTIFGACDEAIPVQMSKVPTRGDRPLEPIRMKRVTYSRK